MPRFAAPVLLVAVAAAAVPALGACTWVGERPPQQPAAVILPQQPAPTVVVPPPAVSVPSSY